ncbi:MAG: STAS/SEC14 domain-containing protein [Bacteroidota bacterium]
MFKVLDFTKDNIIAIKASGKIQKSDYQMLDPLLEKTEKEHPSIKLYILIGDIDGITPEAFMKDVITYFKHIKNVDKAAIVGGGKAEKSIAKIADPFIKGDLKYFPLEDMEIARKWIEK